MPFTPPLPDRPGRGAFCQKIEALVKEIMKVHPTSGSRPDKDEFESLWHRLDKERAAFHRLYPRQGDRNDHPREV